MSNSFQGGNIANLAWIQPAGPTGVGGSGFAAWLQPIPTTEHTMILYVAELSQRLCHSTILSCLSAVRHLHLTAGHKDPLKDTVQLELVLKGVKRRQPHSDRYRLPITIHFAHHAGSTSSEPQGRQYHYVVGGMLPGVLCLPHVIPACWELGFDHPSGLWK